MHLPPWAPTLTDGVVTLRAAPRDDADAVVAQCQDPADAAVDHRARAVRAPPRRRSGCAAARARVGRRAATWRFAVEAGGPVLRNRRPAAGRPGRRPRSATRWDRGRGAAACSTGHCSGCCCPWGFEHARARGRALGRPSPATGPAGAPPGVSGSGSRARCAAGCRSAGTGTTPGWARCVRGERAGTRRSLARGARAGGAAGSGCGPYRGDDVPRIVEACSDPRDPALAAPGCRSPYTADDARAHLEHHRPRRPPRGAAWWAVAAADDDRLVGEIAAVRAARSPGPQLGGRVLDAPRRAGARLR